MRKREKFMENHKRNKETKHLYAAKTDCLLVCSDSDPFSAAVLLMSILGVIPGMDLKVGEMLSAQQKNTVSAMTEQTDIMMARSISLSEEITKELSQYLTANGKAFSDLNDNPQLIMDLEAALYSSLRSALDVKYCSGVLLY